MPGQSNLMGFRSGVTWLPFLLIQRRGAGAQSSSERVVRPQEVTAACWQQLHLQRYHLCQHGVPSGPRMERRSPACWHSSGPNMQSAGHANAWRSQSSMLGMSLKSKFHFFETFSAEVLIWFQEDEHLFYDAINFHGFKWVKSSHKREIINRPNKISWWGSFFSPTLMIFYYK